MKIGLISSVVPLIQGGGRFIVDWLCVKLQERGHQVEIVYIPCIDDPDTVLQQMVAFRLINLEDYFDCVITFRPPAHVVRHSRKIVWFIHHIRVFYDLWDSEYRPVPDLASWRAVRDHVRRMDTTALREARHVFTNSAIVGVRLRQFNNVPSEILYPPIFKPDLFTVGPYGDEIVCVCRVEHHKRQHLLVQAMAHVTTDVTLRLCGEGVTPHYIESLRVLIAAHKRQDRIIFEHRWISEAEKAEVLSQCLACAYIVFEEDSYGYPTVEAAHANRCTITLTDSGGTLEFVQDEINGFVLPPEPEAIAVVFDRLYADRTLARRLGEAARARIDELGISWDHVIEKLLS